MSGQILSAFELALSGLEGIKIRCNGFMFGIELPRPCAELVQQALDKKVLINVTTGNVIRLLPPLVMTADEANLMVTTVSELVIDFMATQAIEGVA
jgi:acetylornithine aminotransferase